MQMAISGSTSTCGLASTWENSSRQGIMATSRVGTRFSDRSSSRMNRTMPPAKARLIRTRTPPHPAPLKARPMASSDSHSWVIHLRPTAVNENGSVAGMCPCSRLHRPVATCQLVSPS